MRRTKSAAAKHSLNDAVERAVRERERVIIHRRKKPVAAVVPIEDYDFLESLEDRIDIEEARKVLKDPRPTIPWEQVKKDLGL